MIREPRHCQSSKEIYRATGYDQEQKSPVPPTVKNKRRNYHIEPTHIVASSQYGPGGKEDGSKYYKNERIKLHKRIYPA